MGCFGSKGKLIASAVAFAMMMAVPATAAPSFAVFAEEEIQETAESEILETKKPAETSKATKTTETQETESAKKPSETTEETVATETSKIEQTEETKQTESSETVQNAEILETAESEETAIPEETEAESEETITTETSVVPEETVETVTAHKKAAKGTYSGIKIDGSFSDWGSVVKHDFTAGENSQVNEGALVWDGEWIYIYLDEVQQNSVTWSGPERYGNLAITTDTGKTLVIHLENNGSSGNKVTVENNYSGKHLTSENGGIKVAFNNGYSTWGEPTLTEIAIPTSALPDYKSKISFGFYQDDPIIKNVLNLHPEQVTDDSDDPHTDNDGSKIKIDGDYRDWTDYPHQIIHYDKSGPGHNFPDAEGAIYQKDAKTVYVHAYTNDFKLDYYDGNEFLEIKLELGGKTTTAMCVQIDDDGNIIDWNASDKHYETGTYKFAIVDTRCWRTTTNINHMGEGDVLYGIQYLTVGDPIDETEFNINTETLAKYLGVSGGELKVTFHRVGQQPLIASGVSSGPLFTIALTSVAAGSYYVFTRRKRRPA